MFQQAICIEDKRLTNKAIGAIINFAVLSNRKNREIGELRSMSWIVNHLYLHSISVRWCQKRPKTPKKQQMFQQNCAC